MLTGCSRGLSTPSLELLLEVLLVLAQDDWPQVSKTARGWLQMVYLEQQAAMEQGSASQVRTLPVWLLLLSGPAPVGI